MKRRTVIGLVVILALVVGVLAVLLLSNSPKVSLTFVEYTRWPHGALLRLKNGGSATIRYYTENNGTPAGIPLLEGRRTAQGWTNTIVEARDIMALDPKTMKLVESFHFVNAAGGTFRPYVSARELKPDRSVEFWISLEPGGDPKRVGTFYSLPQGGELEKKRVLWSNRIRQWFGIKTRIGLLRRGEVWCPEALTIPPLPPSVSGK